MALEGLAPVLRRNQKREVKKMDQERFCLTRVAAPLEIRLSVREDFGVFLVFIGAYLPQLDVMDKFHFACHSSQSDSVYVRVPQRVAVLPVSR